MKRPHITEVRPTRPEDGEFFTQHGRTWLAINSLGYRFGSDSEAGARELADEYHNPPTRNRRASKEPAHG
jgi:hypothetical protein